MKINEFVYKLKGKDAFVTKNHTHDEVELIHVSVGEGSVLKSDRSYALKAGHLYLIDARRPHIVHPERIAEYTRSKLVMDAPSFFAFCESVGLANAAALFSLPPTPDTDGRLDTLFKTCVSLCETKDASNIAFAHGYLLEMLHIAAKSEHRKKAEVPDKFLESVLAAIESGKESLETIAAALNYNKYYLCHRFKDKTGVTLSSYLSEKRYERAVRLLREGGSAESVSDALGFANPSAFSRFFKQKSGLSPREYKKGFTLKAITPPKFL